jgi:hypothetical protein
MIRVVHPGPGSRIRILTLYPSQIPDPGVKKTPDPDPQHCFPLCLLFCCGFSLLTCRARSVEHKELILRVYPEGFRIRAGLTHQLMVPLIPSLPPHLLYTVEDNYSTAQGLASRISSWYHSSRPSRHTFCTQ